MIPTYDINNLTGNLDVMFQNVMRVAFTISIILLTIWIILSLLIWLFRSQTSIRKSNKIWNKELYYNFYINSYYISYTSNAGRFILIFICSKKLGGIL